MAADDEFDGEFSSMETWELKTQMQRMLHR